MFLSFTDFTSLRNTWRGFQWGIHEKTLWDVWQFKAKREEDQEFVGMTYKKHQHKTTFLVLCFLLSYKKMKFLKYNTNMWSLFWQFLICFFSSVTLDWYFCIFMVLSHHMTQRECAKPIYICSWINETKSFLKSSSRKCAIHRSIQTLG